MKQFLLLLIAIVIIVNINIEDEVKIPKESIRFRIIANSNSKEDQELKMQIVKELEENYFPNLNYNNINSSRIDIQNNMDLLESSISKYTNNYEINYGSNFFPNKRYRGIEYEEGNYESVVVSLGESKGDNFWCVLFPPLCLLDGTNKDTSDVEYRSLVKDVIKNISKQ